MPDAIHRELCVQKPSLLELWRPGRDGMPLCLLKLVVWRIEEGAGLKIIKLYSFSEQAFTFRLQQYSKFCLTVLLMHD